MLQHPHDFYFFGGGESSYAQTLHGLHLQCLAAQPRGGRVQHKMMVCDPEADLCGGRLGVLWKVADCWFPSRCRVAFWSDSVTTDGSSPQYKVLGFI